MTKDDRIRKVMYDIAFEAFKQAMRDSGIIAGLPIMEGRFKKCLDYYVKIHEVNGML